jgi:hypothetical protein
VRKGAELSFPGGLVPKSTATTANVAVTSEVAFLLEER